MDTIHRKRLSPLRSEITQKKITTVVAEAGYGKTILISQTVKQLNLNTVWYTLDASDRDISTFLSYLISGVKSIFPSFGVETIQKIDNPDISHGDPREILTLFVNELDDMIGNDFFLVFDDYHSVQAIPDIKAIMEFLLDYLPPRIHTIIISRFDLNLPVSGLRSKRAVCEIRTEDLAFSVSETEQLFNAQFKIAIKTEHLKILQQKTEGWISSLILFYHTVRQCTSDEIKEKIRN